MVSFKLRLIPLFLKYLDFLNEIYSVFIQFTIISQIQSISCLCSGSLSEGIYRRSGANTSVSKLLTLFRQDAWAVQLSRQEFSEYDVASVLKRFFRDLPEPLLTSKLHASLCETSCEY